VEPIEEKKTKVLHPNDWRILKKIFIFGENGKRIGCIAYTRSMDDIYIINVKPENNNNCLYGAKQEDYPSDEIDLSILESIKKEYPQSEVINDTIFFEIDQRKIDHIENCQYFAKGNIIFILVPEDNPLRYMISRRIDYIEYNIVIHSNSEAYTGTSDFIVPLPSKFKGEISQIQFLK